MVLQVKYFFLSSIFLLCLFLSLSLFIGPVKISFYQIIEIILSKLYLIGNELTFNQIQENVLINIRLPRIILALLVGVGLGTAGAMLQGLFRNPLIDPGFIGVSSGAAVGAMVGIMFVNTILLFVTFIEINIILPLLSILGSFLTTILVFNISKVLGKTNIMAMLLTGIAINALSGSIIGFFVSISSDAELRSFTFWTLGGLDKAGWSVIALLILFIVLPLCISLKLREQLDIFMLGDAEASHLGVNVEKLKKIIIVLSSTVVGISVAFCGMIGFVGLVTPHLVRLFIGPKHKYLLPGSAILGAILLIFSDLISRTIIAPAQLPIGVVTSAIGSPFFIWLIVMQKKRLSYGE